MTKSWGTVTVRQLLSMRSGVQDYEDTALFEWTLAHPDADYLPEHFLSSVNKSFAFPPGQGGLYMSDRESVCSLVPYLH